MKFNSSGNWARTGTPIFNLVLSKSVHGYPENSTIQVVESQHPSFTDHWQIFQRESLMIKKEFGKLVLS